MKADTTALSPRRIITVTRVVLVRHGQVEISAQGRCCGRFDPPLSPTGTAQMKAAATLLTSLCCSVRPLGLRCSARPSGGLPSPADRLRQGYGESRRSSAEAEAGHHIQYGRTNGLVVYASPSRRAIESARALVPHVGVRTDARLHEIDFGKLEGLRFEEAARLYPDVYRRWIEHPHLVRFPDGESFSMMRTRVLGAWEEMLRRHAGHTIAIVAHEGVNRIVLARVLDLRPTQLFRLAQDTGAVNIIEYNGTVPTVRLLNGVPSPSPAAAYVWGPPIQGPATVLAPSWRRAGAAEG